MNKRFSVNCVEFRVMQYSFYGLPIYKYDYIESRTLYSIHTDVIVRFSGKCTVEMIKSLVEHSNVKPPVANGLALFVKNNYFCGQCEEPMSLVKGRNYFLKCKKCNKTQMITTDIVNRYLDSTGGRCPRCGRQMFASKGPYGIYIRCSENHISKINEI